jgi:hypothetical protein
VLAHLKKRKRRGLALSDVLKLQAEASSLKLINIDVIGAPREVRWLRSRRSAFSASAKITFSASARITCARSGSVSPLGGDRKHVVQLLLDFEDLISVEVDQKRAKHVNLRTEDLMRARAKELGEARRSRDLKLLQRLTFHEEPVLTLHVSEPTHTMHAVPKPTDAPKAPNPEPTPVRDLREHLDGGIVATFFTTLFASKAGPPPPDLTDGKLAPEPPNPIEGASACARAPRTSRSMKDTSPHRPTSRIQECTNSRIREYANTRILGPLLVPEQMYTGRARQV